MQEVGNRFFSQEIRFGFYNARLRSLALFILLENGVRRIILHMALIVKKIKSFFGSNQPLSNFNFLFDNF